MGPNRIMISGVSDTATPNGCLEPVMSRTSGLTTGLLMDVQKHGRPVLWAGEYRVSRLCNGASIETQHSTEALDTAKHSEGRVDKVIRLDQSVVDSEVATARS
jgi:hypothetical protein